MEEQNPRSFLRSLVKYAHDSTQNNIESAVSSSATTAAPEQSQGRNELICKRITPNYVLVLTKNKSNAIEHSLPETI